MLSVAAMFVASAIAVFETNLKRMLAYSSVAQIGYITLGIGLANQAGLTGGIVHLFNHAHDEGDAVRRARLRVLPRRLRHRSTTSPGSAAACRVTMTAFTVAGLGLIGVPGTVGFISKWYLALGALENGSWLLVFLIVASSLDLGHLCRPRRGGGVVPRADVAAVIAATDPPLSMLVPLVVLAVATVYFGIDTRADRRPRRHAAARC